MKKMAVLAVLLMVFACASAQAASIALNFWGASDFSLSGMYKSDVGGQVSQANWNNIRYYHRTLPDPPEPAAGTAWTSWSDMVDSTGTATTMDYYANFANTKDGEYEARTGQETTKYLHDSYRGIGWSTASTNIHLVQIPYTTYDVYMWMVSNDGTGTASLRTQLNQTGSSWDGDPLAGYDTVAAVQLVDTTPPPVVAEPAGLGLIGLALLAVRKRRS